MAAPNYSEPAATKSEPAVHPCHSSATYQPVPPERANTKPLFRLLARKKETFNSQCPLRASSFLELLEDYPSPECLQLLEDIIKYGAKLGYSGPSPVKTQHPNQPSAKTNRAVITKEIRKEPYVLLHLFLISSVKHSNGFCSAGIHRVSNATSMISSLFSPQTPIQH